MMQWWADFLDASEREGADEKRDVNLSPTPTEPTHMSDHAQLCSHCADRYLNL